MVLFSRKNLCYTDYQWNSFSVNDPRVSGKPDETPFNRLEGAEMVYLVNKLMVLWDYRFVSSGTKMEKLIREKMPEEIIRQKDVFVWLKENLKV